MSNKSFVFQDTEVKLTGRTASKATVGNRKIEMVEITPVDQDAHGNWKKWTAATALFEINPDGTDLLQE